LALFDFLKPNKGNFGLVLDIGTEFIKALIFEIKGDEAEILGVARVRQKLTEMRGGVVLDIEGVIKNSQEAIARAEEMAKATATQVIVGIAGELVKGTTTTVHYSRAKAKEKITYAELRNIVDKVQRRAFDKVRESLSFETGHAEIDVKLVNAAIVDVKIDGYRVTNPLGFQGKDVSVSVFNAFAPIVHLGALQTITEELGLDLIITDHHLPLDKKPDAYETVHSTKMCGAAVGWCLIRDIIKKELAHDLLQFVALATVCDVMPLLELNRAFLVEGLKVLNRTTNFGLLALINQASISLGEISTYEVGHILGPRLNAMGRLEHAIDSLRLLCTKNRQKAQRLAGVMNKTNLERQRIVDEVVVHAKRKVGKDKGIIILAHESYHEGVIGLAAARLVEEFYRPAIVISIKGGVAKASARSISGFNIIETIRKVEGFILEGGGHPMAAGFSIESVKLKEFSRNINKVALPLLTKEILTKKLKIDLEIDFSLLNRDLLQITKSFEPTGLGNPTPTFATHSVTVADARVVGRDGGHLKLKLEQGGVVFDAIAFKRGELYKELSEDKKVDVIYVLEENMWNSVAKMELKIRDIKISS